MLTFQWKYKKLKQIESIEGCGTPGTFSQDQIPRFRICQNGVCAKETKADIAEQVFSKGQHELKTLNVFFESALKIYHFTLF